VVRDLFRSRSGQPLPEHPEAGRSWLGTLGPAQAHAEVVLVVRAVVPEPWVEVHCHGGREVIALLLDLFRGNGLQEVAWDEFLHRTEGDPWQAVAAVSLARAPTLRTAALLLDQYHGALKTQIQTILDSLQAEAVEAARHLLEELASRAGLGRRLTTPWQVVVAGAPNVGKSSLVNALAGYQRSIVAPLPGTTRDVVRTRLAVEGWPIELADTAGLRAEAGTLEQQGINRARSVLRRADLCLWVLDAGAEPVWPDEEFSEPQLVINKIDLPPAWDLERAPTAVRVSARTGQGVPELLTGLAQRLVPQPPPPGAAVPFTGLLADRVETALQAVRAGDLEAARSVLTELLRVPPGSLA
jgi:tRNA modification GTPase